MTGFPFGMPDKAPPEGWVAWNRDWEQRARREATRMRDLMERELMDEDEAHTWNQALDSIHSLPEVTP